MGEEFGKTSTSGASKCIGLNNFTIHRLMDLLKASESEMAMYFIALNVDGISGRIFKTND